MMALKRITLLVWITGCLLVSAALLAVGMVLAVGAPIDDWLLVIAARSGLNMMVIGIFSLIIFNILDAVGIGLSWLSRRYRSRSRVLP